MLNNEELLSLVQTSFKQIPIEDLYNFFTKESDFKSEDPSNIFNPEFFGGSYDYDERRRFYDSMDPYDWVFKVIIKETQQCFYFSVLVNIYPDEEEIKTLFERVKIVKPLSDDRYIEYEEV